MTILEYSLEEEPKRQVGAFFITKKDRTTGLEENKRKDLFTSNQFYDASQIENESILYKFKNKRKKNSFISSLPQLDFDASSKNTTMAQKWQRDSSNRKKIKKNICMYSNDQLFTSIWNRKKI